MYIKSLRWIEKRKRKIEREKEIETNKEGKKYRERQLIINNV